MCSMVRTVPRTWETIPSSRPSPPPPFIPSVLSFFFFFFHPFIPFCFPQQRLLEAASGASSPRQPSVQPVPRKAGPWQLWTTCPALTSCPTSVAELLRGERSQCQWGSVQLPHPLLLCNHPLPTSSSSGAVPRIQALPLQPLLPWSPLCFLPT